MGSFMYIFTFILGTAVGSFINAFEYRLYSKKPIVNARSQCPQCQHLLAWYDLVPLLSFIFLRGKCRYCRKRISLQYPLVELVTGILFVLAFYQIFSPEFRVWSATGGLGFRISKLLVTGCRFLASLFLFSPALSNYQSPIASYQFLFIFFIIASLEIIFIYDLKYGLIPDEVVFTASLMVLGYQVVSTLIVPGRTFDYLVSILTKSILSGIGAGLFFVFLIILTKGKGMGGGDVKLVFLMGLILSFPRIVFALYLAFLSGALISIILVLLKKREFSQTVPFGPFLVMGTLVTLLC